MKFACKVDSREDPCFLCIWTLEHFLGGLALCVPFFFLFNHLKLRRVKLYTFIAASFLHLLYEIKDILCHDHPMFLCYQKNSSLLNGVGDQIAAMTGAVVFLYFAQVDRKLWLIVPAFIVVHLLFYFFAPS